MTNEIAMLSATAASIGFFHTITGPDHYLPFIMMARAGKWNFPKTMLITFLCGLGHVLSSVVLGFIGVWMGFAVKKLEIIEGYRGSIAAWALIVFGFLYCIWGIKQAINNKSHQHLHVHEDGEVHIHDHNHAEDEHMHVHGEDSKLTPWILFTIFVLGPCEPLIPILMYPAAKSNMVGVITVSAIFSTVTVLTMMSIVVIGYFGINFLPLKKLERYTHALAGGTICLSGLAIQFLGL